MLVMLMAVFIGISLAQAFTIDRTTNTVVDSQMQETLSIIQNQMEQSESVEALFEDQFNEQSLSAARTLAYFIQLDPSLLDSPTEMDRLARLLNVDEVHVTDAEGVLTWGNRPGFYGLDFADGEQTTPFMEILADPSFELAQEPMPRASDGVVFAYAGVSRLDEPGIVQAGVSSKTLTTLNQRLKVQSVIENLMMRSNTGALVLDADDRVIADSDGRLLGRSMSEQPWASEAREESDQGFSFTYGIEQVHAKSLVVGNQVVIVYMPESELESFKTAPVLSSLGSGAVALIVFGIMLYVIVTGFVIRPIERLTRDIENIKHDDIIDLASYKHDPEVRYLATDINNMVKRLESSGATIAELRATEDELQGRLEQQELMSKLSRTFVSTENTSLLIDNALGMIGRFMGVSRILLSSLAEADGITSVLNVWSSKDAPTTSKDTIGLGKLIGESFPALKSEGDVIEPLVVDDINSDPRYAPMRIVNVKSFIWVPLYLDGRYTAILSIEECLHARTWTASDVQLIDLLSNIIASAFERASITASLIKAREEALAGTRAKSAFLSNMSHEIRTPMNAIIGMTAIGQDSEEIERKDYCFGKIEEASTHLLNIINDILDMSKIEANKLELTEASFDLERLLQKAASVISYKMHEKGIDFQIHMDPAVPVWLNGDDQRITQVITNLLSNAAKFTPEGGAVRLSTKLLSESDGVYTVQVDVADTGIGVSEEQHARLFSSFQQAENSTSRKYGGTGLGLAISKQLVEMMNGRIWVESEPGKGSVFSFTFECTEGTESGGHLEVDAWESSDRGGTKDALDDFSGHTVLLAEDVEVNREIVLALLEPTHLAIDMAEDGFEAVAAFKADPMKYDMIFMDVQMPEMDGIEATRQIRALNVPRARDIPIVAMTANVFKEDIERCTEVGMNGHLGKPIVLEEVLAALRTYLC